MSQPASLDAILADVIPPGWRLHSVDGSIAGRFHALLTHAEFIAYASGVGPTLGAALLAACRDTAGAITRGLDAADPDPVEAFRLLARR